LHLQSRHTLLEPHLQPNKFLVLATCLYEIVKTPGQVSASLLISVGKNPSAPLSVAGCQHYLYKVSTSNRSSMVIVGQAVT
jgi:hypothetical protein